MTPRIEKCKSCGAPILWCRTIHGKMMPVDAEPHAEGNLAVENGEVFVVAPNSLPMGGPLRRSHFATCVNARQHRKDAANGAGQP